MRVLVDSTFNQITDSRLESLGQSVAHGFDSFPWRPPVGAFPRVLRAVAVAATLVVPFAGERPPCGERGVPGRKRPDPNC